VPGHGVDLRDRGRGWQGTADEATQDRSAWQPCRCWTGAMPAELLAESLRVPAELPCFPGPRAEGVIPGTVAQCSGFTPQACPWGRRAGE